MASKRNLTAKEAVTRRWAASLPTYSDSSAPWPTPEPYCGNPDCLLCTVPPDTAPASARDGGDDGEG